MSALLWDLDLAGARGHIFSKKILDPTLNLNTQLEELNLIRFSLLPGEVFYSGICTNVYRWERPEPNAVCDLCIAALNFGPATQGWFPARPTMMHFRVYTL